MIDCECRARHKGRDRLERLQAELAQLVAEARRGRWYEDDSGWDDVDLILRQLEYDIPNSRDEVTWRVETHSTLNSWSMSVIHIPSGTRSRAASKNEYPTTPQTAIRDMLIGEVEKLVMGRNE